MRFMLHCNMAMGPDAAVHGSRLLRFVIEPRQRGPHPRIF